MTEPSRPSGSAEPAAAAPVVRDPRDCDLQADRVALIDFSMTVSTGFALRYAARIQYGGVAVSRCILPPNPGLAIGSPQITVAIHDDAPFDMEWRSPVDCRPEQRRISQGDVHINPADRPIFQRWSASPAIVLIALEPAFARRVEAELFDGRSVALRTLIGVRDSMLEAMAEAWRQELAEGGAGGRLFTEGLGAALAVHLYRKYGDSALPSHAEKNGLGVRRLQRVAAYIDAHLADDLSLPDLAAVARMSVHHFSEAFRVSTGRPPHRYVIERRVLRAKELLLDRRCAIAAIALQVGFGNQSHFTVNFRKVTGLTPSRFRSEST